MKQKLKRYEFDEGTGSYEEDQDGRFVKFSDIEPLIEAVRFYGNKENWRSETDHKSLLCGEFLMPEWGIIARDQNGEKARQALRKVGVE